MAEPSAARGPLGCLVRLFWMAAGNLVLVLCLVSIVQAADGLRTADLIYWLTVAGLLAVRWTDIRWLGGTTADGQPASMAHWRRYAILLAGLAAAAWLAVHARGFWMQTG